MKLYLRERLRDIKFWFRGMRRTAPYGATGRTHEWRPGFEEKLTGSVHKASSKPVGHLSAKIIKADGTVVDLGRIGEARKT